MKIGMFDCDLVLLDEFYSLVAFLTKDYNTELAFCEGAK